MAQMTKTVARGILNGQVYTSNEVRQLAHQFLVALAEQDATVDSIIDEILHEEGADSGKSELSHQALTESIASMYQLHLELLVKDAERAGISVRVTREPLQPLAMGHMRHIVEAWPARHQPETPKQP